MNRLQKDIVIIGGGPAGLAAAVSAYDAGCRNILILERDRELGGILNQCIHNGFGLHTFGEELTGPEYAGRFIERVKERQIAYALGTMVLDLKEGNIVCAMNREQGVFEIEAGAIVLAMGCRERARGALNIPGYRPAGIYSAGTAQYYVNREGYLPGREVVILGSGDIGLIMARRMTLEGATVRCVAEIQPYSGGLKRNIVQCLDDYNIPLRLRTTVIDIIGRKRVEAVVLARVDENNKPIPGTEETVPCDTLLLSCGLLPENELTKGLPVEMSSVTRGPVVDDHYATSVPGVFACGNVLHVHDLVDYVSREAGLAGRYAAEYVASRMHTSDAGQDTQVHSSAESKDTPVHSSTVICTAEHGVRYTVPEKLHFPMQEDVVDVKFRVDNIYRDHYVSVYVNGERIQHIKKRILSPGEMETVKLLQKQIGQLFGGADIVSVTVRLEEE